MLQHNAARAGRRAHVAHAAMMSLHALCCGLPALALLAVALSGAASGAALFIDFTEEIHSFLHGIEIWLLVLSAALVVSGGWFEVVARRHGHRRLPWLFLFSVISFGLNVAIIVAHRV